MYWSMNNLVKRTIRKIKPIRLGTFNLFIALWIGVILNLTFYEKLQQLSPYEGLKESMFILATIAIVVALYNFVLQFLSWKWSAKFLAIILIVVGGMSAYFVNSLGVIITSDQIQNMMQTDANEVKDLFSFRLILWVVLFVVLPILLICVLKIRDESLARLTFKKIGFSLSSLVIIAGLLFTYYVDYAAIFREHRDLKGMISPQNVFAATTSYFHKQSPKKNLPLVKFGEDAHLVEKVNLHKKPKLMVLVVGETARAESFSLNGYVKNTNPELSKHDVVNFSQVSSCGTATAVSVPCMFSGMSKDSYDAQLASHKEGLLDIAQRAGYKVTWIDNNSGCKGACDRVEEYEIPKPIQNKWCDKDGECLDGILVDSLKQYIADIPTQDMTPRLIVLHQMGSHGPAYYKRTTKDFEPFQPTCQTNAIQGCSEDELVNTYDNSIVYTDHVLSQMIDTLKENSKFETAFWYLSDHGESTGEKGLYLHGAPYSMAPSQQTHIPMLMWFSSAWKSNHVAQVSCLNSQKNKQLSQDNLFPTLLSLLGVKTQVIHSEIDLLNQCNSIPRV